MLCGIVSTLVLTAFLLGIRLVLNTAEYGWWCAALLISVVQVVIFSPIDSEGRRLTQNEKKVFKKIATALSIITVILCAVLAAFHQMWAAVSIGSGLILSAALQFPCLFQKKSP